jgi:hypothetical protein
MKIFINIITQYGPLLLPHNVYIIHTVQGIKCPRRCFFLHRLNSFVTVCWIDVTALNLVLSIVIFKLGTKKSQPVLNQGSRVNEIRRGSLVSPETRKQSPKNAPVHCRAEYQEPLS